LPYTSLSCTKPTKHNKQENAVNSSHDVLPALVKLGKSLTLKLAYTPPPPPTSNSWTSDKRHRELKFGMQAYLNPTGGKIKNFFFNTF
jgi:hypothetical protein